jgi:hypothetical protein
MAASLAALFTAATVLPVEAQSWHGGGWGGGMAEAGMAAWRGGWRGGGRGWGPAVVGGLAAGAIVGSLASPRFMRTVMATALYERMIGQEPPSTRRRHHRACPLGSQGVGGVGFAGDCGRARCCACSRQSSRCRRRSAMTARSSATRASLAVTLASG